MSRLRIIVKVLPDDVNVNLEKLHDTISEKLPQGVNIVRKEEEPIAFGITALILSLSAEEKDGVMDQIEESIKATEHVSQLMVTGISRESVRLG